MAAAAFMLAAGSVGVRGGDYREFTRDYSSAFAMLEELGLESTKGATYGRVDDYGLAPNGTTFPGLYDLELAGNLWRAKSEGQSKNVWTVTTLNGASREADFSQAQWGGEVQWKKVALKKDVEKVLKWLEAQAEAGYEALNRRDDGCGALVIFATRCQAHGFGKEANLMVAHALASTSNPRLPIAYAICAVAAGEYNRIAEEWTKRGDWPGFARELRSLEQRFGAVWAGGPVVLLLAEKLEAQAELSGLPHPAEGFEIGPADEALVERLLAASAEDLNLTAFQQRFSDPSWLFAGGDRAGGEDMPDAGLLGDFLAKGVDSIPLLLTMAEDSRFLRVDPSALSGRTSFGDNALSQPLAVADVNGYWLNQQYDQMKRPKMVSDIARMLMEQVAPNDDYLEPEEVVAHAREWYLEHRGQSGVKLALAFFTSGSYESQLAALQTIAKEGSAADFAEAERHLLELPADQWWLANQYLAERGVAGKAFFEAYRARVESEIAGMDEAQAARIRENLDAMAAFVSDQSVEELMAEAAVSLEQFHAKRAVLTDRLNREEPQRALDVVLSAANGAEEADVRRHLLALLQELSFDGAELTAPDATWRRLLADDRAADGGFIDGASAAWNFAVVYEPQQSQELMELWSVFGSSEIVKLLHQRAETRLAGKTPEALPSADTVAEARREELANALKNVDELAQTWKNLGLAEKLAVRELVEPREVAETLAPRLFRVDAVEEGAWASLADFAGQPMNREILEKIAEIARERGKNGETGILELEREAGLGGFVLRTREFDFEGLGDTEKRMLPWVTGQVTAPVSMVVANLGHGMAVWLDDRDRENPSEEAELMGLGRGGFLERYREQFFEQTEMALQPARGLFQPLKVTMFVTDSESANNYLESLESENEE